MAQQRAELTDELWDKIAPHLPEPEASPRGGRGRPRKNPERLIYDGAADSDPLRDRLSRYDIELICLHRRGCGKPKTQNGRKLRRYKRRWEVVAAKKTVHRICSMSVCSLATKCRFAPGEGALIVPRSCVWLATYLVLAIDMFTNT